TDRGWRQGAWGHFDRPRCASEYGALVPLGRSQQTLCPRLERCPALLVGGKTAPCLHAPAPGEEAAKSPGAFRDRRQSGAADRYQSWSDRCAEDLSSAILRRRHLYAVLRAVQVVSRGHETWMGNSGAPCRIFRSRPGA